MSYDDDIDDAHVDALTDDGGDEDDESEETDDWSDDSGEDLGDDWDAGGDDGGWDADASAAGDGGRIDGSGSASSGDGDSLAMGSDGSDMVNAIAGFNDPTSDADPQRARVVGWYAVCMYVADGGRACGYREYAMDQASAQAKKNSHATSNPTHANAVVVQESNG